MNRFKKVLAMLLSIMMVMGSMPVDALAEQFVVETQDVGQPAAVAQPTYTITFNSNDGQGQVPSQKVGKRMILPSGEGLSRENHTFMGWGLDPNSGLSENNSIRPFYLAGHEVSIRKDTTFYAVWATAKEATYFIRLDGIIPQEPCNPPKANYTSGISGRVKYNTFYANTSGVNGHLETIPTTKEIRELCNQNVGNISFANGEGKYEFCASDGEFEDLYHVVWYVVKLEQDGYHVDGVLLKNNMYTLRYDPNCDVYQGEVPPGQQYKAGTNVQITNNIITRNGYTFVGWNTKADGSGTPYSGDGSNCSSSLIMPPRDVILYAQWDPNYLIKYKYTGDVPPKGSVSEPPARRSDVDEGEVVSVPSIPTIYNKQETEGYTHGDWQADVSLNYIDGTHYSMPARNITWTLNWVYEPTYIVNYYHDSIAPNHFITSENGRGKVGTAIPYDKEKSHAPDGYWKVGKTYGQTTITKDEAQNVLNVVYTKDTPYRVEFYYENANDNSFTLDSNLTAERKGTFGGTVSVTDDDRNQTKGGIYTYDEGNRNEIVSVVLDDAANIKVLKLYFTRKTYSVTYQYTNEAPVGASPLPVDSKQYKHGETVNVQQVTQVPAGYTFSGWSPASESNLTEPIGGSFAMPANNVVLQGSWTANTNTPYKVEYYLENLEGTGEDQWLLKDNVNTQGETGKVASYEVKTYSGFNYNNLPCFVSRAANNAEEPRADATILGDGSLVIKLYYTRQKVDVAVTKTWEDDNNRDRLRKSATDFTVKIQANVDGVDRHYFVSTWTENGNIWTGTIENVPTHTLDGTPIEYTVSETNCNGYEKSGTEKIMPANENDRIVSLTNKHAPEQVTISATKVWSDQDNKYKLRPASIEVGLFADGQLTEKQAHLNETTTSVSWTVNKNNENGVPIQYTVRELKGDNTGYQPGDEITFSNDATYTVRYETSTEHNIINYTITNTLKTMNITGEKKWQLNGATLTSYPTVTVALRYNNQDVATATVDANNTYHFDDVPYRESGYTVVETNITGGSLTVMNASGVSTVDANAAQYFKKGTVDVGQPTGSDGNGYDAIANDLVNTLTVPNTNTDARAIRVTKNLDLNGMAWPADTAYPSFTFTASWNGGQTTFNLTPVGDVPTATSEQIIVPADAVVTVTEDQVNGWTADSVSKTISKDANTAIFTNTRSVLTMLPSVQKLWKDQDDRDIDAAAIPTAFVQLYRRVEGTTEETVGAQIELPESQTYTVPAGTKLPTHNEAGHAYSYYFREVGVTNNKVTLENKTYDVTESTNGSLTTITNKLNVGMPPKKTAALPGNSSTVKPDDVVTYTITRKNHHNEPATVIITDKLGEGLTYTGTTSVTVGGTSVTVEPVYSSNGNNGGSTLVWDFGDIKVPAGADVEVVYTVKVGEEAKQVNELTNTASVNLNHEETSDFTTTTKVITTQDNPVLTITKTAIDRTKQYGLNDKVTYDIVVTNSGNVTLTDVKVTDAKIGASFVNGDAYTVNGNDAVIGTMEKGTSVTVRAEYIVTEADIKSGSTLTNTATVTGLYKNVGYSDSDDEVVNLVAPSYDYTLEKSVDNNRPYRLNETVPFTITVKNTGNQTLTNIVLTEQLEGATILDAQGNEQNSVTITSLTPGDIRTFTAHYTVTRADLGSTNLKNTVKSTCAEITEDKTANAPFTVEGVMQVEVTKQWESNGVTISQYPSVEFTLYWPDGTVFDKVSTPKTGANIYVFEQVPYRDGFYVMETGITGGTLIDNGVEKTAANYFTVSASRLDVKKKNAGDTVNVGKITNTIRMSNKNEVAGAIKIQKQIDGNAWPQETYPKFDFTATWVDANGQNQEVHLSLTPDKETKSAVSGQIIVPLNTEVTVTEAAVSGWTPNYATDGAKVTVTDAEPEKTVTITNTYAASGEWMPEGITKILRGEELVNDQFAFVVKEGENTVSTGSNKADGTIVFTPIPYTEVGTHDYIITEVAKEGYYAEPNAIHVTATVTDNADGTLQASTRYVGNTNMTFTNYKLQKLTIQKEVDWQGTEASDQTFSLTYSYLKPGDTALTSGTIEARYDALRGNVTYAPSNIIEVPYGVEVTVSETVNTDVWTPTYDGYNAGKDYVTVDGVKTVKVTNKRNLYNNDGILNVKKAWKDAEGNTLTAPLPSDLTVGLFANGATNPMQTITLSGDKWEDRFTNLPATDMSGTEINYAVKEFGQEGSYVGIGEIITLQATDRKNYEYTFESNLTGNTATLTNTLCNKKAENPVKTGAAEGVQPGDIVPFVITTTNNLASAADVVIKDTLVKGLSFDSATVEVNGAAQSINPQSTSNADGSTTYQWTIANVPPMSEIIINLKAELTADAITIDSITNTATAKVGNQTEMSSTPVTVKHPKLTITKTANPDTEVKPGETITYTLNVVNSGDADATDVVVTDTLPDEVKYVNQANAAINVSGQTVTWTVGTVDAKKNQQISFTVQVKDNNDLNNATSIRNVAYITGINGDPDLKVPSNEVENQIARIKTEKEAQIADGKTKTVASVGDIVAYTITVTNNGGVNLTDVVVDDAMFAQAVADTLRLNNAPVTLEGGKVSAGELAIGAIVTITYDYEVKESDLFKTNAEIVNTVTATGKTPNNKNITDDDSANVMTDGVNGTMTITKNVDDTTSDKNDELAFLFTVSGVGISDDDHTFALKKGQSKTISGLGIGAAYTVTEVGVEGMGDNALNAWDTTINGESKTSTTVTIDEQSDKNNVIVTNTRKNIGTMTVQKFWKNGDATNNNLAASLIPTSVQIALSGTSSSGYTAELGDTTRTLEQATEWQTTYNNLPETDLHGNRYIYTVKELGESDGKVSYTAQDGKSYTYDVSYSGNTVTNTLADNTPTPTTKQADKETVQIGDTITYTITRTSHLNQTTTATITDTLPEGLTYESSTVNGANATPAQAGQKLTWTVVDVAPMATVTVTVTAKVNRNAVKTDKLTNKATIALDGDGTFNPESGSCEVEVKKPNLSISKVSDKTNASIKPGEALNYTITVNNTGAGKATEVEVKDTLPDTVYMTQAQREALPTNVTYVDGKLTWSITEISKGEQATLNFSVMVKAENAAVENEMLPVSATKIVNTATITEQPPVDPDEPDPTSQDETPIARFTLAKTATLPEGKEKAALNDIIAYTVTVSNNGGVALEGVKVSDAMFAKADLNSLEVSVSNADAAFTLNGSELTLTNALAVGATATITYTYTVTETDILAESVHNVVTVTTQTPTDEKNAETTTPTEDPKPELAVEKKDVPPQGFDGAYGLGETITYAITVKNVGNVTLTDIDVTDSLNANGESIAKIARLEPNAEKDVTFTYVVTKEDILAGFVKNVATATGKAPDGNPVTATDSTEDPTDPMEGKLEKTKVTLGVKDGESYTQKAKYELGDTIWYSITVTNTGNVDYTNVVIRDDLTGLNKNVGALEIGQSVTEYTSYTLTEKDILNGGVSNYATVDGTTPTPKPTDPIEVPKPTPIATPTPNPEPTPDTKDDVDEVKTQLTVEKTTTSTPKNGRAYVLGETIAYEIVVKNDSNVTLTNVVVTDELTEDEWTITSLAPGSSEKFTTTYQVTEAEILAGKVENVATAKGESPDPDNPNVTAEPSKTEDPTEGTTESPTEDPTEAPTDAPTENPTEAPTDGPTESPTEAPTDGPTESPTEAPTDGPTENPTEAPTDGPTDSLTEAPTEGPTESPSQAPTEVPAEAPTEIPTEAPTEDVNAHLLITKTTTSQPTNGTAYALGETITYEIEATNDGNLPLTNVVVTDELTGDEWTIAPLAPGSSEKFTTSYQVTEADILAGNVVNVATATGESPDPEQPEVPAEPGITDDDVEARNPHLTVTKTVTSTPANAGGYGLNETIQYEITVTNDGNLTVENIAVTDSLSNNDGNVIATIPTLRPGESSTVQFAYVVTGADLTAGMVRNQASAVAPNPDPDGEPTIPVTPGETESPVRNVLTLTINYWYDRVGGEVASTTFRAIHTYGQAYSVASPRIPGYTADITNATGRVYANTVIDVIYTRNTYTVTVQYRYLDGKEAAPDQVRTGMLNGDAYSIESPTISGWRANKLTVEGKVPGSNVVITVFYLRNGGGSFVEIDEYGVPLGVGNVVVNVGDCFE